MNRSQVPKYIKRGIGKVSKGKGSNQPMKFKRGAARKPRTDTGKKLTQSHNTPNLKYYKK